MLVFGKTQRVDITDGFLLVVGFYSLSLITNPIAETNDLRQATEGLVISKALEEKISQ
jgi:hypothetical protein